MVPDIKFSYKSLFNTTNNGGKHCSMTCTFQYRLNQGMARHTCTIFAVLSKQSYDSQYAYWHGIDVVGEQCHLEHIVGQRSPR